MIWRRVLPIIAICASSLVAIGTPVDAGTSFCTNSSTSCVIAAGNSYLKALVSHNVSELQIAPSAVRTENGIDTGDGGANIAHMLATNPEYLVVKDIRDVRWYVSGDNAFALYLIDTAVPDLHTQVATVHVAERFMVAAGLITQIEAFYCAHPGLTPQTERTTSAVEIASEQCFGP